LNWLNFFETPSPLKHSFGRSINAKLSTNEEELFNSAYEAFEKKDILNAYEYFFKTLENFSFDKSNNNIILNKDDYYYKLSLVTQRNSWKGWILYMLDAVEKTSLITNSVINDILQQMDLTFDYAKTRIKWYNKEINETIFSQPYIKQKTIGEIIGKTARTTLTKYMKELVDNKILTPKKIGVEVYYLNNDLIRILEDN